MSLKDDAKKILDEIKKVETILLHCHPSPDPDSVGSALAMRFALESLGKRVTVIKGDSEIPQAFMHFPGAKDIVRKNFFEVELGAFDMFIALDSGSTEMISRRGKVEFPPKLKVINIDHHRSNPLYGQINLVLPAYPATCQILFDLFREWNITLNENIAKNLFIGIYTDTQFIYPGTTSATFMAAGELVQYIPDLGDYVGTMINSNTKSAIIFQGLALSSIETFCDGKCAISSVSNEQLIKNNILTSEAGTSDVSSTMRTVIGWDIDVSLIEYEKNKTKASLRTRNAELYDVSRLAVALGGGGHKAAAGAFIQLPLKEAKELVVAKVKELYNL